jgi:NADPH:quinone reductase-like Zn-dependent oxidoreductase
MKAVVCTKYGPPEVLELREVEKPAPKRNEALIKIHATSVTASDCIVRGFKLPRWSPLGISMAIAIGFTKPRKPILGMVLAGEIEAVGEDVKSFEAGDPVYGSTARPPTQIRFGAYAEYTCLSAKSLIARKPSNVTDAQAAAIPYGASLALPYLRKGKIQSGQNVLIYGASGAIGTMAVQFAKYYGAKVTGVCSTANLELVKSLGADAVIDYTKQDFPDQGALYDLVLDAVGKRKSSALKVQCQSALTPNGKYVSVDDGGPDFDHEDLALLSELVQAGTIQAVIDRTYPLERIVEAHRYVDEGHKKGNVVITVSHDSR